MLTITDKQYHQLVKTNIDVNNKIKYKTDKEQYGEIDTWVLPERFGDCEDYVLEKRRRLQILGWDPLELKITICYTEKNEGHAVLSIDTNRGSFILDNRFNTIQTFKGLRSLGYTFIRRQKGKQWVSIK